MAKRGGDELKLPSYIKQNRGTQRAPAADAQNSRPTANGNAPAKKTSARAKSEKDAGQKKQPRQRGKAEKQRELTLPAVERRTAPHAEAAHTRRRKRVTVNYKRLIAVAAALIAVVAGAIVFISRGAGDNGGIIIGSEQILPKGVSILGLEVGGSTKNAARNAVTQMADEIIASAAVTLNCAGEQYVITGEDISLAYDIEAVLQRAMAYDPEATAEAGAVNITDVFTWNPKTLSIALENIAAKFNMEPLEASANAVENGAHAVSFSFTDGRSGRKLDVDANTDYIASMFAAGNYTFTMDGIYDELTPSFTSAALEGSFGLRASYTTQFGTSRSDETVQNRVFNIEKAAGIINGCMVAPGAEWSFNGFVGLRTYEDGWKAANGIADGKEYTLQAGGGICQVSSTLYNALLCADVEVTDRRAHTIPSTYVDKGLDATVDSTGIDLKFKNNTEGPLYLFAYIEPVPDSKYQTITFDIYGKTLEPGITYKTRSEVTETIKRTDVNYVDDNTIPRGYKLVTVAARDGYKVEAYRDKYVNGTFESTELLYSDTYRGNAEEARRGTASPKYYKAPEGAVAIG